MAARFQQLACRSQAAIRVVRRIPEGPMTANKILVVRHAEKPGDAGTISGVDIDGNRNRDELTVRGWQRAGALVRFFAPIDGHFRDQRIETPGRIFASRVAPHSKSLRSQTRLRRLRTSSGEKTSGSTLRRNRRRSLSRQRLLQTVWSSSRGTMRQYRRSKTRSSVTTLLPEHGTGTGSISCGSSLERRQAGVSSRFRNFSLREIGQTPLSRSHPVPPRIGNRTAQSRLARLALT
jgi:hypothetical protein